MVPEGTFVHPNFPTNITRYLLWMNIINMDTETWFVRKCFSTNMAIMRKETFLLDEFLHVCLCFVWWSLSSHILYTSILSIFSIIWSIRTLSSSLVLVFLFLWPILPSSGPALVQLVWLSLNFTVYHKFPAPQPYKLGKYVFQESGFGFGSNFQLGVIREESIQ